MTDVLNKLTAALDRAGQPFPRAAVLMVSGGSDSTALAYAAATAAHGAGASAAPAAAAHAHGETAAPAAHPLTGCALAIMHLNHGLRGEAARADAAFVERLAATLRLPFYLFEADIDALAREEGGNVEAIGRRERYDAAFQALADLCAQQGIPFDDGAVFTAHTQDDRVENFYMRSIVGTGPGGFRSMDYANGQVLHPLLDCSREELRAFINELAAAEQAESAGRAPTDAAAPQTESAERTATDANGAARTGGTADPVGANGASDSPMSGPSPARTLIVRTSSGALWCEDATNAETDRFRTYVRHEIVPRAKAQNPQLLNTLTRSMNLIADEDDFLEDLAAREAHAAIEWTNPHQPDVLAERMGGILPDMHVHIVTEGREPAPDYSAGCVLLPRFAAVPRVLQRRIVFRVLQLILGEDARVETASVEAVLASLGKSGHVTNIQGNLAVSTNRRGTRIEPMDAYRARRKRS